MASQSVCTDSRSNSKAARRSPTPSGFCLVPYMPCSWTASCGLSKPGSEGNGHQIAANFAVVGFATEIRKQQGAILPLVLEVKW